LSDTQPLQHVQHPAGHLVGGKVTRLFEGPLAELSRSLRFAQHVRQVVRKRSSVGDVERGSRIAGNFKLRGTLAEDHRCSTMHRFK
jgi:hypothetical protein